MDDRNIFQACADNEYQGTNRDDNQELHNKADRYQQGIHKNEPTVKSGSAQGVSCA